MLTDDQLAEWQRLADEATPGPWEGERFGVVVAHVNGVRRQVACAQGDAVMHGDATVDVVTLQRSNGNLIASARTAVPALIAEVRRLTVKLGAASTQYHVMRNDYEPLCQERNALQAEVERLRVALDEREGDVHLRVRAGYDKAVADAWRAKVAEIERERDDAQAAAKAYKRDFDAELAGNQALRDKLGARKDETMFAFHERLVREHDEALEELSSLEDYIREKLPYVYDDGEDPPDEASASECVDYAAKELAVFRRERDEARASATRGWELADSLHWSVSQARRERDDWFGAHKLAREEVERLSAALTLETRVSIDFQNQRDEMRAEVERLRKLISHAGWDANGSPVT
jgi:hypothetical protein